MLYHWKVLHLPVTIRPIVEFPSGAVNNNPRLSKVILKLSVLEIGLNRKRYTVSVSQVIESKEPKLGLTQEFVMLLVQ